jgi:hypothetical protein
VQTRGHTTICKRHKSATNAPAAAAGAATAPLRAYASPAAVRCERRFARAPVTDARMAASHDGTPMAARRTADGDGDIEAGAVATASSASENGKARAGRKQDRCGTVRARCEC